MKRITTRFCCPVKMCMDERKSAQNRVVMRRKSMLVTYLHQNVWRDQAPIVFVVRYISAEAVACVNTSGGYVFQQKPEPYTLPVLIAETSFGVELPPGTQQLPHHDHVCFLMPGGMAVCLKPWRSSSKYEGDHLLGIQVCQDTPRLGAQAKPHLPQQHWRYRELDIMTKIALGNAGGRWNEKEQWLALPVREMEFSETCNGRISPGTCWYLPTGVKIHILPVRQTNVGTSLERPCWSFTVCAVFSGEVTFLELPEKTAFYSGACARTENVPDGDDSGGGSQ